MKKTPPKKKEALKLLQLLQRHGFKSRLVGGCVRDEVLGLIPSDYDIATAASPEEIEELLQKARVKALTFGKSHGTITAVLYPNNTFEITSLREDVSTDGRRAVVTFHEDFEIDARRRDFTMNAMSEDADGHIYDYFDGKKHLQENRLVFVGDAVSRIREDYLRILRFFRFKSRFNLHADKETLQAIQQERLGLKQLSRERITHELLLTFVCENLRETAREMLESEVLQEIFGTFSTNDFLTLCSSSLSVIPEDRALMRLTPFSLSPLALTKENERYVSGLCWAREHFIGEGTCSDLLLFVDQCENLARRKFIPSIVPYLSCWFDTRLLVATEEQFGFRRGAMPLRARDLLAAGYSPGPQLGEMLSTLYRRFLDGEWETLPEGIALVNSLM